MSAKALHVSISTTAARWAFFVRAWEARGQLTEYERNGFSQFFYLTVVSHIETSMSELIERRLGSIYSMSYELRDKSTNWEKDGEPVRYPFATIYGSLKGVLGHFGHKVDRAPLENLRNSSRTSLT